LPPRYAPLLQVLRDGDRHPERPPNAGDYFTVIGCGYDTSLGNVVVGFTGGSWGSPLDANGCFTIPDIPALSGDTLPAGTYEVPAYQHVRGKLTETGDTTVTVVV
jgi:hypothetical protein